jgi:hypothetical protein
VVDEAVAEEETGAASEEPADAAEEPVPEPVAETPPAEEKPKRRRLRRKDGS